MIMPSEMDLDGGGDDVEAARHRRRKRSTALVLNEVLQSIYITYIYFICW